MSLATPLQKTFPYESAQRDTGKQLQFELFSIFWAAATLFHMANDRSFTNSLPLFILTGSAILLLIKPSSVNRLVLLIVMQLFEFAIKMPAVSNHWVFTAIANLTILQAIIYLAAKNKTFSINKDELLRTFAPVVRIELLILYFYVVFHKLNSDFFSPATSCATDFVVSQISFAHLPQSPNILALGAYFTVVVEALIPIMLCFRKTRDYGVLIGLLFHCVIAYNPINGFYDFSSVIFASYILFTTEAFAQQTCKVYSSMLARIRILKEKYATFTFKKLAVILAFAGACLAFIAVIIYLKPKDYFRDIIWSAFSLAAIGLFLVYMTKKKPAEAQIKVSFFSVPSFAFLLFPVLIFLNGFSPYLGLKTENSFAMFSNLRTEGGKTNHFIVPISTQIFDYQKDLIEVISSSDPRLEEIAKKQQLVVCFEFKNLMSYFKPDRVEYIRGGKRYVYEKGNKATYGDLLQRNPKWQRAIMNFRNINKYDPQPCNH